MWSIFSGKIGSLFHDCVKNETSSVENPHTPLSNNAVINGHTPPDSPGEGPLTIQTNVEIPNQTVPLSTLPVKKKETCQMPCDERELADPLECNNSGLTSVNGAQSFLEPFYRHLYFSTSHQSMIPALKWIFRNIDGSSFDGVGETLPPSRPIAVQGNLLHPRFLEIRNEFGCVPPHLYWCRRHCGKRFSVLLHTRVIVLILQFCLLSKEK
ncbi:zinc finger protein 418 [Caerostris extrusa]|uniref:Zinc finger protein 418 n=1 Tax=Caerostris extrusa TaxID=172846 RepID=A0AAV4UEV0_CAEEX|nr:zinc finger protein 418 [Caerostris extrusa]